MQLVSHAIDICLPQEQERINLIAFNLLSIAFDAEEKQGERRKRLSWEMSFLLSD